MTEMHVAVKDCENAGAWKYESTLRMIWTHCVTLYNKVGSLPHKTDDSNCAMGQK